MHITRPGLRATLQDRGRAGARSGIPPSGPADPDAFSSSLALAGCGAGDAAIEVVGLPFAFRCDDLRVVAATGRDVRMRIRSRLPGWTSVLARPGEEVIIEGSEHTRYAYVAVSGGIVTSPVLGSRSTYLPAGIGAVPRALVAGDELPLGSGGSSLVGAGAAGRQIAPPDYARAVRAVAGPHDGLFPEGTLVRFFGTPFSVLPESDRMGVRLGGVAIGPAAREILSCGVVAGAVQVPAGGAPIVLLADHQTTGGYPIIATVITADLGVVAQAAPGETLRFVRVTAEAAQRSL